VLWKQMIRFCSEFAPGTMLARTVVLIVRHTALTVIGDDVLSVIFEEFVKVDCCMINTV